MPTYPNNMASHPARRARSFVKVGGDDGHHFHSISHYEIIHPSPCFSSQKTVVLNLKQEPRDPPSWAVPLVGKRPSPGGRRTHAVLSRLSPSRAIATGPIRTDAGEPSDIIPPSPPLPPAQTLREVRWPLGPVIVGPCFPAKERPRAYLPQCGPATWPVESVPVVEVPVEAPVTPAEAEYSAPPAVEEVVETEAAAAPAEEPKEEAPAATEAPAAEPTAEVAREPEAKPVEEPAAVEVAEAEPAVAEPTEEAKPEAEPEVAAPAAEESSEPAVEEPKAVEEPPAAVEEVKAEEVAEVKAE
ncbi:hypothetical protein GW17_00013593 [Ensete ventricosum]|nr:hypothetical protein GW17_00013593 [Ensete ventricosum]